MSKRNTILALMAFIVLAFVVIQTGLAADDRIFYGLIGLFILAQIFWLASYWRKERKKEFVQNLDQLFPDD